MRGGKMESRRAKRCMKAFGSGVSSKRVRSKRGSIDFNKSSLPRRVDFEKEHDVSDDEDWIKSLDDLARHEPGAVV